MSGEAAARPQKLQKLRQVVHGLIMTTLEWVPVRAESRREPRNRRVQPVRQGVQAVLEVRAPIFDVKLALAPPEFRRIGTV
jgi:hypothetical protein